MAIVIIVLGLILGGCGTKAASVLQPRSAPAVTCVQSVATWSCR
jgi:hypothetical protein